MRKPAAIILSAAAIVMFSGDAEARRLRLSLGKSSTPAPVSKPAVAPNASHAQSRSTTFIMVGTGQNRPMAAAPRTPVPEGGPLHDLSHAAGQFAAASEKPAEQNPAEPAVIAEQQRQPEPPAVQPTPLFVSMALPPKPAERVVASVQPARTVYCLKQAGGGCAPF